MALTEVRLRPTSPWRTGNRTGDRDQTDAIYHSDSLYSAMTHASDSLGWLDEWLAADVRLSSLFPFIGDTRLVMQPRAGRLAPLAGSPVAESAYRISVRTAAAIDRQTGVAEPHSAACLEFARNAGWWGVFDADDLWTERVKAAFRLLADSGFGGE